MLALGAEAPHETAEWHLIFTAIKQYLRIIEHTQSTEFKNIHNLKSF